MEDRRRFLQNLAKRRYLAMAQYLPKISKEKIQEYSALILTLIALIVFGVFAINPTLTTVIELRKQLEDSQFAVERLKTKVVNLNALSQQYQVLQPDLPILLEALPQKPSPSVLLGQIHELANQEGVKVLTLDSSEITLYPPLRATGKEASFIFTLSVQGNYNSLLSFMDSLITFNRLVQFESISYLKPEKETILPRLSIRGRAYFLP